MKRCKCKYPTIMIINGMGIKCARCKLWITKIRKTFYKPSKAKPNNKKYDRKKNKIKKEDL